MNTFEKTLTAAAFAALLAACDGGGLPEMVGRPVAHQGNGPVVKFNMFARPLPEVPLPNDIATRYDPNSPTGRRLNASVLAAPTDLEQDARRKLDQLDGWGVYGAISVGFTHENADADPDLAVLDLGNIVERHVGDDFDLTDDVLYVINIDPASPDYGHPVPVDLGEGDFPVVLQEPNRYYENDPRGQTSNVLFETVEEDLNGNGRLDPGEDTDFDGVLDHPNVLDRTSPSPTPDRIDVVYFYERETNTLLVRPIVPLQERTKYAVVLTRRLVGENGEPVRSPFPYFHHVDQAADFRDLDKILGGHSEYYGDLDVADVAFAWSFTTESVRQDILTLIQGLEAGTGPFARLAEEYPRDAYVAQLHECNPVLGCREENPLPDNLYIVTAEYLAPILLDVASEVFDLNPEDAAGLIETYQYVDYFVFGWLTSPQFLDNDADGWEEQSWDMNWKTGRGKYTPGRVNFLMVVPKQEYIDEYNHLNGKTAGSPAPVVFYGHGYTGFRIEGLGFAGSLAKYGLATVDWDCVHHGVALDPVLKDVAMGIFDTNDLHAAGLALLDDRAIDLDNDEYDTDPSDIAVPAPCDRRPCFPTMHFDVPFGGFVSDVAHLPGGEDTDAPNAWLGTHTPDPEFPDRPEYGHWSNVMYQDDSEDSAGDFWTAYIFHTRDVVRQSALDLIRIIHYLRGFDGRRKAQFDVDGDGAPETYDFDDDGRDDLSGDFDGDTSVDIGGPENEYYIWGQSLGGIMSGVLGGTHTSIKAVAPVAGGGGLGDVGIRSTQGGVKEAVILRIMGPLVVTVPAASRYNPDEDENETMCCDPDAGTCDPSVISLRFIIPQQNNTGEVEIACLNTDGDDDRTLLPGDVVIVRNMRRPEEPRCFVAAEGSRIRISMPSDLHDALEITIYDGSSAAGGAYPLVDAETCTLAAGVRPRTADETGAVAPIETFEVDPPPFEWDDWAAGDMLVTPAEGYGLRRGTAELRRFLGIAQMVLDPGDPAVYAPHYQNSMVIATIGDMNVPVNTGISISRCAGTLAWDAASRDPRYGDRTPNRYLLDTGVIMGLERLSPADWRDVEGRPALFDPDDLAHGTDAFGQPRPATLDPPLAPARIWRPSEGSAAECTTDYDGDYLETVDCERGTSALVLPYISAQGDHGFYVPQPSLAFDVNTFMINMIGRYFGTQGRSISYESCMEDNTCEWIPPIDHDWPPGVP